MSMISGRAARDLRMVCVTICGVTTVLSSSPARAQVGEGTALAAATAQLTSDSVPVATTSRKPVRKPVLPTQKPPVRPEFKSLRFEEAWTSANRSPYWNDALKAMPLASQLTLTLGGQLRWREEFAHAFNLTNTSDTYAQSRILLNADLKVGDARRVHGRVYVEARDAQSYDRQLPGGTRPTDADRADVQNLFADAAVGRSYVRVGRQEIVSGRERLIGVPDWANTRRAMQGVRTVLVRGALAIDAMDVHPVAVRVDAPNRGDSTTRFRVLSIGSAPGAKPVMRGLPNTWQTYWYEQVITAATSTRRLTTGGRAAWTFGSATKSGQSYGFETEGAVQRGATGARALDAWFFTAEAQTQWRGVPGTPSVAFGWEEASGDRSSSDATLGAFNALYAAAHAHGGYADVFGRANARQLHLISTWDPIRKVNLRGAWHRYDRRRLEDGIYTKQHTILRAASGSRARHAGDEFDLTGNLNVNRNMKVIFGYAVVLPGAFLRDTPGGAQQERWGFVGTTFTF